MRKDILRKRKRERQRIWRTNPLNRKRTNESNRASVDRFVRKYGKAALLKQRAKAAKLHRTSHPGKVRARKAVFKALRSGKMKKHSCWCGSSKVEAHHEDYRRPLKVKWLCRPHHQKLAACLRV